MLILDQLKKQDRHLQLLGVIVLAGMAVLAGRLWYIQVISQKRYQSYLEKHTFRMVQVPAVRGKILDANHQPIADNRPCYNVNVYLEEFSQRFRSEYKKRKIDLKKQFGSRLQRKDFDDLEKQVRFDIINDVTMRIGQTMDKPLVLRRPGFEKHFERNRILPLPVSEDLSSTDVAHFFEKGAEIPAVSLEAQPIRSYVHSSLAAHVVGSLKSDNTISEDDDESYHNVIPVRDFAGAMGIERTFEPYLRGKSGIKSIVVNSLNYRESESILVQPEPGSNVVLTIDISIQKVTEQALKATGQALGLGTNLQGAAVVMDVWSGDILAMASCPSFDPNDFVPRLSTNEWERLQDPELTPMLNRATVGMYPPGSTFKIIVSLACLEDGLDVHKIYASKGAFRLGAHTWGDTAGAGDFDFNRAFYKSSNPYFQEHGLEVGAEKIVEMGRAFCLGEPTGLEGYPEKRGYFPPIGAKKKRVGTPWNQGDTANLSIGQGEILVTPLQMATVVAAVANGGKVLKPRLIKEIEPSGPHGEESVIRFPSGQIRSEVKLKPQSLELLRAAMLMDTEYPEGTGKKAAVKGLHVYGKTGTAQLQTGNHNAHTTWFASYCTYLDRPRYAVLAMVEFDSGGSGGTACAPVAGKIYEALLKREQALQSGKSNLAQTN